MRSIPLLVLAALLLAGCGGSDAREATTQAREAAAAADEEAASGDETFVPEALRGFRCEADEDGTWSATGGVRNTTDQPVGYRVTVQVGQAGDDVAAAAVDLPDVEPETTAPFALADLPAAGADGPCRVQVVAVAPE